MARRRAASDDHGEIVPVVERLVEQRYSSALGEVDRQRALHPTADVDELVARIIRRYARELAIGGAVTGGAAAAPVAGVAVAAASAGADATFSVGRLSEMVMAIGIAYGHDTSTVDERRTAVLTVMGLADGAAVGVSGLAARVGARGGSRLIQRLPTGAAPAGAGAGRRAVSKLTTSKGPWSLTALIPYGIGAGVGATGNVVLAQAVGRAAKQYFAAGADADAVVVEDVEFEVEVEVLDGDPVAEHPPGDRDSGDVVDAEIVDPHSGADS